MSAFRPLYDYALRLAKKPHARLALFIVALIEPCLVPIPPDLLLIPMILARREKSFQFATICTAGSVLGGVIGYGIGALAMATVGQWFVEHYHLAAKFDSFSAVFREWGMLIIFLKGFIPFIPFMVVSVVCGATHFNLGLFIFAAAITRGGRFFLEATLLHHYGQPVQDFIERYMTWIGIGILALLAGIGWFLFAH
jgi:membrane protein YqaA with SNARE-associated domain